MDSLPQKLLGYPPLQDGESLASFLVRLGRSNFYDPSGILTEHILNGTGDEAHLKDRVDLPKQAAVFERIARLAPVDCLQLYAATAHRFTQVITPPDIEVSALNLPGNHIVSLLPEGITHKQLRPVSACQYCPLCVQQRPYHRVNWLLV